MACLRNKKKLKENNCKAMHMLSRAKSVVREIKKEQQKDGKERLLKKKLLIHTFKYI